MQQQATTADGAGSQAVTELDPGQLRRATKERTLRSALKKRAVGVPTYSVPEAAALMSVSQEHLYRLIRAGAFPAVPMRDGRGRGRYVVPAIAVEELLNAAAGSARRDEAVAGGAR
jgi:excisionase family DNA binding protein